MLYPKYVYRNSITEHDSGEDAGSSTGSEDTQQTTQNAEVEAKARKLGWTPKEEFRGDPEKWRDAAEFVERGENMVPLLRSQVKRQDKKIDELQKTLTEFAEFHSKVEQKAYERAFKELKARQVEAISRGDAEAFVQVDEELASLQAEAAKAPKLKVPQNEGTHPDYAEWLEHNQWANTDQELIAYAESQAQFLRARGDAREGMDFLNAVKERVKKEFPEKFGNPRRNAASSVEGSSAPSRRGKTFADLPAEAKAACNRFVEASGGKLTKETYVAQYFADE